MIVFTCPRVVGSNPTRGVSQKTYTGRWIWGISKKEAADLRAGLAIPGKAKWKFSG